ncbi:MFS transporter [archaeon]|nr:MAG: MFS transporter [archaeon]
MYKVSTFARRQLSCTLWRGNKNIGDYRQWGAVTQVRDLSKIKDTNNKTEPSNGAKSSSKSLLDRWFGLKSNIADTANLPPRWTMLVPAFMNHLCIGSPYAWSMMADELTRELGFVVSSAQDWTLMQAALPLSLVFIFQGLAAAYFGKWQIKVGVRKSLFAAASCFGGGLLVGSAGIYMHSLPLLYLGYGVLAGTGIGLGYTPPVQALMQWFPDKKGIASGITIAGFGSGALLFTQCIKELCRYGHEK